MANNVVIGNQSRSDVVNRPSEWVVSSAPGANAQATCNKAAPGAGFMHVVTALSAKLTAGSSAPTAANVALNLIFGISGASASATWEMSVEAVAGDRDQLTISNLSIEVTANTQVTFEFAAAAGANTVETVVMTGYTKNQPTASPLG